MFAAALWSSKWAFAAPRVWVIDDGEKIKADATALPFASGASNPIWAPGQPARLFAMKNETVALQVVVEADASPLDGVTVDLASLSGPNGAVIANDPSANDPAKFVGRRIERFVEHYFTIARASGGTSAGESLGWSSGSGPAPGAWTGQMPDALLPVEAAPSWDAYPMHVAANTNKAIWIDISIPKNQTIGHYRGSIDVRSGAQALATIPVELEVVGATLPDRPLATMLYYDKSELDRRIGAGAAEEHLWQLYRRHRVAAMHSVDNVADLQRQMAAIDGSEFTAAHGYEGPGESLGDGIVSIGTYGSLGAPSTSGLSTIESIADLLAQKNLFATNDVFVYAIDESCGSSYGAGWKKLLAGSSDANAKQVKVGWTCSQNPASQPVDVPIVFASSYDPASAAQAKSAGKSVWIYNGSRPQTDAFLTDTSAVALRANAWIGAMAGIGRWFYWETTFWYDDNKGGKGAYDPFVTAETFHNSSGDFCEGDGVLVYPGRQVDPFTTHSIGIDGVLASIRLKNLRRGIEDAGYLQMARAANAAQADAIAKALLPKTLSAATDGQPVSWSETGKAWFDARKALLALIPQEAPPPQGGGEDAGAGADADAGASADAGAGAGAGAGESAGAPSTGSSGGCGISRPARVDFAAVAVAGAGMIFGRWAINRRRRRRTRKGTRAESS